MYIAHSVSARVERTTRTQSRAAYRGEDSVVGCGMKPGFSRLWIVLPLATALLSCSLPKKTNGGGGGGGGNATLSLTMIDTPPTNSSILSLKATITGIALNPATGSSFSLPLTSSPFGTSPMIVELTRLQSDSAYLGTFTTVPAGTYSSVTVTLANAQLTFANQTTAPITVGSTTCPTNSVCTVSGITPIQPSAISFGTSGLTLSTASPQGISLEVNLNNAITFSSNGTLALDFSQANAVTVATLPRTNSNLSTGQLDLIEDFTGVVTSVTQPSASSSGSVTLLSATRGTLIAKVPSGFIPDDPLALCGSTVDFTCIKQNQTASADAILNTDGTLTLQEIEPLVSATTGPEDLIEGVVDSVSSTNSLLFQLVVSDKELVGSSSQLAGLNVGDQVQITIVSSPSPASFSVDTKNLNKPGSGFPLTQLSTFQSAMDNSVLAAGQTVSVHVPPSSFTAASGTTIAAANVNSVMLRWSRITGTVSTPAPPNNFNFTPAPFFIPLGVPPNDSTFNGSTVSIRALFFRAPSFVFCAARVRKH